MVLRPVSRKVPPRTMCRGRTFCWGILLGYPARGPCWEAARDKVTADTILLHNFVGRPTLVMLGRPGGVPPPMPKTGSVTSSLTWFQVPSINRAKRADEAVIPSEAVSAETTVVFDLLGPRECSAGDTNSSAPQRPHCPPPLMTTGCLPHLISVLLSEHSGSASQKHSNESL